MIRSEGRDRNDVTGEGLANPAGNCAKIVISEKRESKGESMAIRSWAALAALALLSTAVHEASAHHSVAGQFDDNKRATLTGVISKIDWINPHVYIHLDVPDDQGAITTWRLASLPTAMLRKAGLTQEMLMGGGAAVTVDTILARDGTQHLAWLLKINYPDGHHYQLAGE